MKTVDFLSYLFPYLHYWNLHVSVANASETNETFFSANSRQILHIYLRLLIENTMRQRFSEFPVYAPSTLYVFIS